MDNIARNPLPRVVLTMIGVAVVTTPTILYYLVPSEPSLIWLLELTIFVQLALADLSLTKMSYAE